MSADAATLDTLAATVKGIADGLADLRAEHKEFCQRFAALLAPTKRIEPDAIYSTEEAAQLVPIAASGLRDKFRSRILNAKGGGKGKPWKVRGSELLKLAPVSK